MTWNMRLVSVGCALVCLLIGGSVHAQSVSFSIRVPRVRDAGYLKRMANKKMRARLVANSLSVRSRVSKGYHLKLAMSVLEETDTGDVPSCTIRLRMQMIMMPERRMVVTASSNGRAAFNRPTKMTTQHLRKLRGLALNHAIKNLADNVPATIQKVEEKKSSLPKGTTLGKAVRGGSRGRGSGKGGTVRGRKLNGRIPRLKVIAPGFVQKSERPPLFDNAKQ